jgi:hypothetical protein
VGDTAPPPGIDTSVAHPARIYDHLLGGKDNYEVDRRTAERLLAVVPEVGHTARRNREFIARAVRYVVGDLGIDQIVDIGTGIPTAPAVHAVAREIDPGVRVAYVDNDPIVLAHDRALLAREPGVLTVLGDLTDPPSVLEHPEIAQLVDWSRPVGLLLAAVFHFVPDERDPLAMLAAYRERLAPGSAVVISLATSEGYPAEVAQRVREVYRTAAAPLVPRTRAQIERFFTGLRVVEPGVTILSGWRPDSAEPATAGADLLLCGVGVVE